MKTKNLSDSDLQLLAESGNKVVQKMAKEIIEWREKFTDAVDAKINSALDHVKSLIE